MLPGMKLFDLTGRVAVVTGGSKGLGVAMAAGLASAGADVVLVSRHGAEVTAAAQELATTYGRRVIGVSADVTSESDMQALAQQVIAEFGRIDVLINNAGVNIRGPIDQLSLEQFRQVQQINVEGLWLASRAIVPQMKQQQSGRIINLASALGVVGMPDRTPYCSSNTVLLEQRGGRADDPGAGGGTGPAQHHRQCDPTGTVSDGDERAGQ